MDTKKQDRRMYNMFKLYMIYTKRLTYLLVLVICCGAYRMSTDRSKIPQDMLANLKNGIEYESNDTVSVMHMFPYKIYHHQALQSSHSLAKGYLFLKTAYDDLEDVLSVPNMTEYSQEQQQILYNLLPETILIQPDQHQSIDLQLMDNQLDNHIFIISSKNISGGAEQTNINLDFYQLQTHNYLYELTKNANIKIKEAAVQQKLEKFFLGQNHSQTLAPHQNETATRDKFILYNILGNSSISDKFKPVEKLLHSYYNKTIHSNTRWRAISDGMQLRYFSATIISTQAYQTLELVSQVVRGGSVKNNITIVQPLSYFKLAGIEVLDICSSGLANRVLISDRTNIYVVSIEGLDMHLFKHIKNQSNSDIPFLVEVFFGHECQLFQIVSEHFISQLEEDNVTTQVVAEFTHVQAFNHYPKKRLTVRDKVNYYEVINHEHIVMCWQEGNCSLYETKKFQQLLAFQTSHDEIVNINVINALQNTTITKTLQITLKTQFILHQFQTKLLDNSSQSIIPSILYDLKTYLNHSVFVSRQMDKSVLEHLKNTQFLERDLLPSTFDQIRGFEQGDQQYCHSQERPSGSLIKLDYNQTSPWAACVFDISTAVYLKLRMAFNQIFDLSFRIYLCSYESNQSPSQTVDCQPLTQANRLTSPELIHSLHGGFYYKIYLIKHSSFQKNNNLPTVFIKDIERQQIEIASTIFFYIMLTLSLLLVGAILVVILRNVLASVLIYYGHMEDRAEPNYPLPWFAHRTKIKRLKQIGVLKYVKYESQFIGTDEGNQCCFCLQVLKSRSIVAVLFCGHQFHKDCFNEWIKNEPNTRCPTCRRPFTRAAVDQYHNGIGSNQELPI